MTRRSAQLILYPCSSETPRYASVHQALEANLSLIAHLIQRGDEALRTANYADAETSIYPASPSTGS